MIEDLLRYASMIVWAGTGIAFLPGALRAIGRRASSFDFFYLAAVFACLNRVTFGLTNLYAPEWTMLSQGMGLAAAVWLGVVAYKVVPRGNA